LHQQFPIVRLNAALVHFDPTDDALLVHNKNRAVRSSEFFVKDAVLLCDSAMGPIIRDERVRDTAERFAPRLLGKNRVTADSQYLAMRSFEFGALRFVRRNLLVSGRRKSERMKCQHDVLVSAIVAQLDIHALHVWFGDDAGQSEIRRAVTDFEWIRHWAS